MKSAAWTDDSLKTGISRDRVFLIQERSWHMCAHDARRTDLPQTFQILTAMFWLLRRRLARCLLIDCITFDNLPWPLLNRIAIARLPCPI